MFIIITGEVGIYLNYNLDKCVATVKDNQCFGERALQAKEHRSAWVKAIKPTVCLTVSRNDYNRKIFYIESLHKNQRLKFLMSHDFCKGWP